VIIIFHFEYSPLNMNLIISLVYLKGMYYICLVILNSCCDG
jgi:hypothetical protein